MWHISFLICSWWFVCLAGTLFFFSYNGWYKIRNGTNAFWSTCSASQKSVGILCPTIPPKYTPLCCSWPWPMVIKEIFFRDLAIKQTVNLPLKNSWATSGLIASPGLHPGYTCMHEETSMGHSACGLDWRTKVSACQSLLYARMPSVCTSIRTENAFPDELDTVQKQLKLSAGLWGRILRTYTSLCFLVGGYMQCTRSIMMGMSGTRNIGCSQERFSNARSCNF